MVFKKGRSAGQAIFEEQKYNLYERMYTGCIFVDFSKVFETIDHNILTDKPKFYGFKENSVKMMESYITTCTQITNIKGHTSMARNVTSWTAQGLILGPLIYIIYMSMMS